MFKTLSNPALTWIFGKLKNAYVRIEALERKEVYSKAEVDDMLSKIQGGELPVTGDYYTKEEIRTLLAGLDNGLVYLKVDELPDEGDPDTVYLIATDGGDSNQYLEYIFVDGVYEQLGGADPDLTGYVSNEELDRIDDTTIENLWKS